MNKVILRGNISTEIELKVSNSNKEYVRFNLAVNKYIKKENGEFDTQTTYLPCVVFGYNATKLNNKCKKGSSVLLEGEISYKNEKDENGNYKSYFSVMAEKIEPLSNLKENTNNNNYPQQNNSATAVTNFNEDDSVLWD